MNAEWDWFPLKQKNRPLLAGFFVSVNPGVGGYKK